MIFIIIKLYFYNCFIFYNARHGCTGTQLAPGPVQICVPPSEPTSTDTVQDQGGRGAGLVSGTILAQQDLVPGELMLLATAPPWPIPLRKVVAYALKWNLFVEWCSSHQEDPRRCSIRAVLSFLQHGLERRLSPSTLKVYVAAISSHHDPVEGKLVGKHDLVVRFLRGARRLNPPSPPPYPLGIWHWC